MSSKKEAWGVEVGAQAIKAIKLGRTGDNVSLLDFDVMPFKQVLTTPDLNVEEAIRVNLDALAQKHEFDKSTVSVSVPGHMAFARFAKLPPIEATKVKSIVAYEAQQQIPFPIEEVEWDYQVFAQEDAPDIEVGIFAITKERVANFLSNYRSVGLRVDMLTLSPVAVYNAFAFENEGGSGHGDGTVYLDIGTTSTDIIVVEDEAIWLRTLPLGGNHFTQALMKQFKISFAKAEKLKLEASTSKYAKQIFQAMRGVFSDLVTEIQRSLGFYTSLNRDSELHRIVGVGSTWKLPGLQKYLKQNLQMKVIRPDGFPQLKVEDRRAAEFSSVAVNMATAYGLALQGLGLGTVEANILPQTVLRQRMWKAKQPWIVAAAACVVGAAALGPTIQFLQGQRFAGAWGRVEADITSTISTAQTYKNNYDTVQTNDPRPGIRNYRRSFDYTNLYSSLYEDVAAAIATIEPNEAIRDIDWNNPADVQKVAEVPRENRGFVWVTEVTTQYQAPKVVVSFEDDMDSSMSDPGSEMPPDSLGGGPDPSYDFAGAGDAGPLTPVPFPAIPQPAPAVEQPDGTVAEPEPIDPADNPAPRIIVTVTGRTTMDDSTISGLLRRNFVGWMTENAERADRPYILVPALNEQRFSRASSARTLGAGNTGSPGGQTSTLSRKPTVKAGSNQPGTLPGPGLSQPGGGFDDPGAGTTKESAVEVQTPEGWYAMLGQSSTGFAADALLPKRPLSIEESDSDYRFTFKFEVILRSPDEARKTILPPETQPQPPEDEAPNTPTAADQQQEDQA